MDERVLKLRKELKKIIRGKQEITDRILMAILARGHILLEDVIKAVDLGTLVISNATLGSINACVLTIAYLQQKGIPVRGIILNNYDANDFMQIDNKKMMEAITGVPVLAEVKPNATDLDIDVEVLKKIYK